MVHKVCCVCLAMDDARMRDQVWRTLSRVVGAIEILPTFDALLDRARTDALWTAFVVGSRVGGEQLTPAHLRALRRQDACVPVVFCCLPHEPLLQNVARLRRNGLDAVVMLGGTDRDSDLVREVTDRLTHLLPRMLADTITRSDRKTGVFLEEWCIRNAYRKLSLSDIAAWSGRSERSVERDIKALGWEQAKDSWYAGRLVHIALHLDATEELSIEDIVCVLGFADVSTLRRLVIRMTGRSPRELREAGALSTARTVWETRHLVRP